MSAAAVSTRGPAPSSTTHSPLARRDPTIKLVALTVVSIVIVFVLDPVTPALLYAVALGAVVVGTRAPARTLLLAHVPFVAFAVGVLAVNALARPGHVLWQAGPLRVTVEGLSVGGALAVRTLLIGVLAIGFVLSTDAAALMVSLHQHARLSPRVTYAVLAGYRLLQDMSREWDTIRHAHAVRARPRRDGGRPRHGPRQAGRWVFTLLVVSIRRGERISRALEARGLGLQPRTTWRPVPLQAADGVLLAAVVGVVVAVLAVSAALGTLTGPGALSNG